MALLILIFIADSFGVYAGRHYYNTLTKEPRQTAISYDGLCPWRAAVTTDLSAVNTLIDRLARTRDGALGMDNTGKFLPFARLDHKEYGEKMAFCEIVRFALMIS